VRRLGGRDSLQSHSHLSVFGSHNGAAGGLVSLNTLSHQVENNNNNNANAVHHHGAGGQSANAGTNSNVNININSNNGSTGIRAVSALQNFRSRFGSLTGTAPITATTNAAAAAAATAATAVLNRQNKILPGRRRTATAPVRRKYPKYLIVEVVDTGVGIEKVCTRTTNLLCPSIVAIYLFIYLASLA
jgi:hypothetical protein